MTAPTVAFVLGGLTWASAILLVGSLLYVMFQRPHRDDGDDRV